MHNPLRVHDFMRAIPNVTLKHQPQAPSISEDEDAEQRR